MASSEVVVASTSQFGCVLGNQNPQERCTRESNSPANSDYSAEISHLRGVSSLVQRWKDFAAEAKNFNTNASAAITTEDTSADWDSDRTCASGPPSSRGRDSDATESESVRVIDIIKKLASGNKGRDSDDVNTDHDHTSYNDSFQTEQIFISSVVANPPRIRGRQALTDLLMRRERDRHRELQGLVARRAVSRFPQRGRIQALIRLRFLRGRTETEYKQHSDLSTLHSNKSPSRPLSLSNKQFRHNYSTEIENGAASPGGRQREAIDNILEVENSMSDGFKDKQNITNSRFSHGKKVLPDGGNDFAANSECCHHKAAVDNTLSVERSSTSKRLGENSNNEEVNVSRHPRGETLQVRAKHCAADSGGLDRVVVDETMDNQRILIAEKAKEQEASKRRLRLHPIETSHELLSDGAEQVADDQNEMQSPYSCWLSDISQHPEEDNYDWITSICRPQRDWECLRQERYQEMLDPCSHNEEIQKLLERKSVSSFLSSGLRDRIDRLMFSRTQRQSLSIRSHVVENRKESEGEAMAEAAAAEAADVVGDESSPKGQQQYYEVGRHGNRSVTQLQPPSPSLLSSWSCSRGHEASVDSDQTASPSLLQSPSPNFYSHGSQHGQPFMNNRSSIEMELVYDLKGHMEQLHQEMSLLRRSMKSCIKMQMKLQRSMKKEVETTAKSYSSKGRNAFSKQKPEERKLQYLS